MFRRDLRFVGMPEDNEAPPKISVQSICPACGGHNLDIESAYVLGCQPVKGLDEEGNLVLDRPTFYTDESHFCLSCPDCGFEPDVDLHDCQPAENLAEWLRATFGGNEEQ